MCDASTTNRRRPREDDGEEDEDSPPYNRPKLAQADVTLVEPSDSAQAVRDSLFYRQDGDCILRVEDTLFKIHHHLINHEPSAFYGLFSLPPGTGSVIEGKDDAHPIQLSGDTVAEVHAFLGYAYSSSVVCLTRLRVNYLTHLSPLHLQYSRIPVDDIHKLINTARFTHKYRLDSFEHWAKNAIYHVCSSQKWALLKGCSPELYEKLLQLDSLCGLSAVKRHVKGLWVDRLQSGDPSVTLAHALDVADRFQFRSLQGEIYYLQLQALSEPSGVNTDAASPLPDDLSDLHKLRLLMGFRSLSLAWDRISATPLVLSPGLCSHPHGTLDYHLADWEVQWRAIVGDVSAMYPGVSIMKRLQKLQSGLSQSYSGPVESCPAIAEVVNRRLPGLIRTLRSSMADHFLGPDPAGAPDQSQ